ncbi:hypothetical protein [Ahniella affigens]|uniref:hypothetical protein n=1 Tax=Ahniella affigens TaxID=2021234 RepID=UPI0011B26FD9|nr:hypothetical protein [Ahniella affigens]
MQRGIEAIKAQSPQAEESTGAVAGIKEEGLSLSTRSYIALADFTGRHWHQGKPSRITDDVRPIPMALKNDPEQWDEQVRGFGERRVSALSALDRLIPFAAEIGRRWLVGDQLARKAYRKSIAF